MNYVGLLGMLIKFPYAVKSSHLFYVFMSIKRTIYWQKKS